MAQTSIKQVTVNSIMRRPGFQQGMSAFHNGETIPLRINSLEAEWDYERGRLFAAATGARYIHLKRGEVSRDQQQAFARLIRERIIL